jgi:lipopolysaccharide/colanic/teichoic acid biosynthesis glycosyltransferase
MRKFNKRLFDLALTIPALILLAPVMLVVALLVRIKLGSPVFFCQDRLGLNGQLFRIIKFRSMIDERDPSGRILSEEERIPPFGWFLRKSSLDELPELFCVLWGTMSLVGPRPLWKHYGELYNAEQRRRHEVKPGVTGLVQVKGRNALSWEDRFKFDVWYVDHQSLWLDIKILFQTIWVVLRREGISAPGYASMPMFTGNAAEPAAPRQEPSAEKALSADS